VMTLKRLNLNLHYSLPSCIGEPPVLVPH
jgi:hypothetical protein